jgi:hypothetical protein
MNKQKRKILFLQAAMAKKMTQQVRPVPVDIRKEVNARFSSINYSMLKAAHEAYQLSTSKLARLGRALQQEAKENGRPTYIQWGNFYEAKMLMMMAVSPSWCNRQSEFIRSTKGALREDVLKTTAFFHR